VLDHVFSFVGSREYLYTAAVCRRWQGRYITLCYKKAAGKAEKLQTSYRSTVMSASGLQLAIQSGLDLADIFADEWEFATDVVVYSIDPIAVLAVAKLYDLQWTPDLCRKAAMTNKLDLLRWLHLHKCPWNLERVPLSMQG
jgi:hypothetical protein